jgi:hypothetical protein
MFLTRRHALSLSLAALASPALILPAQAACQRADLDKGVVFRRKDGSKGLARREGDGTVVIDYVTNRGAWIDRRRVTHGVFEVSRIVEESEEPVVGASAPEYRWTYSPKPIWPEDGATWAGGIREVVETTISDENATVQRQRRRWDAVYKCFDPREVTLSGCSYQALSVEAEFRGSSGAESLRWVYFPELGLGLETHRNAISDAPPNGLVALGPV